LVLLVDAVTSLLKSPWLINTSICLRPDIVHQFLISDSFLRLVSNWLESAFFLLLLVFDVVFVDVYSYFLGVPLTVLNKG